jgi:hypothetical protein
MRFLGSLVFALILAATALAAEPVRVSDILRQPTAHMDKRLVVSGVIGAVDIGYGGGTLCPFPAERAQLPAATAEHPICIDLRLRADLRKEMEIKREKYRRAIVEITGLYWHRCRADVREHEPEVVREECKDSGLNGYLGVESIVIRGYSSDGNITGLYPEAQDSRHELTELPQSEERAGIDKFVQTFLTAVRAKDARALALLVPKQTRGFARIGFTVPTTRLYWYVLSPEMAVTNESAGRVGSGYRVYGDSSSASLCFCRRGDCSGQWPRSRDDMYINLASPTVCHFLQRRKGAWWLRD